MRRAWLIAGFAASIAVLLVALVWIVALARRLEAGEAEARRHAAREERVRLALWRMDSALAAFLAFENAAPVDPPDGPRPPDPPWVGERFELAAAGADGTVGAPVGETVADDQLDAPRLLALLGQPALGVSPRAAAGGAVQPPVAPPDVGPRASSQIAGTVPQAAGAAGSPGGTAPAVVAPAKTAAADPVASGAADEPAVPRSKVPVVVEEELTQRAANTVEFVQRQKVAQQSNVVSQIPLADPEPPPAEAAPAEAAPSEAGASAAVAPAAEDPAADSPDTEVGAVAGSANRPDAAPIPSDPPATRTEPAAAAAAPRRSAPRPRGPTGVVRALEPVWVDGRLLLVRRVVRDGAESLQGIAFEEPALRAWLLGEVRDLLPAGDLSPVPAGEASDPGRRLALLPWRLEPGPVPLDVDTGARPSVRLGLTLAAGAIVVVAATAGLLLLAGLRLARRRTEFASAVIHELRTPLTTFRVYTDLLAEDMVAAEERPAYLTTLRREADRLGHLVENVLAFARLERRRAPAAPRVALAPALRAAAERLTRRAAESELELEVTIAPETEDVEVTIEPLALERILDNLCDNSCRYGRGAGGAGLELSAVVRGRHAIVRWRDHGSGVAGPARRRLFRTFQRAGASAEPASAAAGVGLGLALSRQLARRSGGELRYVEPSGGGAAFELRLPAGRVA